MQLDAFELYGPVSVMRPGQGHGFSEHGEYDRPLAESRLSNVFSSGCLAGVLAACRPKASSQTLACVNGAG